MNREVRVIEEALRGTMIPVTKEDIAIGQFVTEDYIPENRMAAKQGIIAEEAIKRVLREKGITVRHAKHNYYDFMCIINNVKMLIEIKSVDCENIKDYNILRYERMDNLKRGKSNWTTFYKNRDKISIMIIAYRCHGEDGSITIAPARIINPKTIFNKEQIIENVETYNTETQIDIRDCVNGIDFLNLQDFL